MPFKDFREFIAAAERIGECKTVKGADWNLEIGAICELEAKSKTSSLLLFDEIKGYPAGYRVAANLFTTPRRIALGLGLPVEARKMDLVRACKDREKNGVRLIPPKEVKDAPILENVLTGKDIDLLKFPTPRWHELDGGRFIGTGSMTVIRDPDEGWVNLACQRVQVQDRNTATIYMAAGRHPMIIRQKYWDRGLACPVAVSCGQEPLIWSVSTRRLPWAVSEYDFTGGLRGEPVEVVRGPVTGLPLPATAEIVLEGEIVPPEVETRPEGPFGEWMGYYASGEKPEAAFRIKAVLHRNNPIIQGNPPSVLPPAWALGWHVLRAAVLWNDLDRQVPGVKGVWMIDEDSTQNIPVIALKQEYEGHAAQAAMVAAGCAEIGPWAACRYIIIVDDDIDPTNVSEVLWALTTRSDPDSCIDIVRALRSTKPDPFLSPEKRKRGELSHSVAIIRACKPYHWIKEFPPAVRGSPELLGSTRAKWAKVLGLD